MTWEFFSIRIGPSRHWPSGNRFVSTANIGNAKKHGMRLALAVSVRISSGARGVSGNRINHLVGGGSSRWKRSDEVSGSSVDLMSAEFTFRFRTVLRTHRLGDPAGDSRRICAQRISGR